VLQQAQELEERQLEMAVEDPDTFGQRRDSVVVKVKALVINQQQSGWKQTNPSMLKVKLLYKEDLLLT